MASFGTQGRRRQASFRDTSATISEAARCPDDALGKRHGESFTSFRHRIGRPLHSLRHPVLQRAVERLRENVRISLFGNSA